MRARYQPRDTSVTFSQSPYEILNGGLPPAFDRFPRTKRVSFEISIVGLVRNLISMIVRLGLKRGQLLNMFPDADSNRFRFRRVLLRFQLRRLRGIFEKLVDLAMLNCGIPGQVAELNSEPSGGQWIASGMSPFQYDFGLRFGGFGCVGLALLLDLVDRGMFEGDRRCGRMHGD